MDELIVLCTISFSGPETTIYEPRQLHGIWDELEEEQIVELWLTRPGGEGLGIFMSGSEALLLYMEQPGDAGYTTRNPNYRGAADAERPFILNNGQRDVHPASWLISRTDALRGAEHFAITGERDPRLNWHDDA